MQLLKNTKKFLLEMSKKHEGFLFLTKLLFILGIALNLSLIISLKYGFWNNFFYDTWWTKGFKGGDFYAIYQAGNNLIHGISIYETDPNLIHQTIAFNPYRYLPPPAILGAIFNLIFTPQQAYWFWVFFLELLLGLAIYLTWCISPNKTYFYLSASMWLIFSPFYPELYMGQFSFVQGFLIFLMGYALIQRRPALFDWSWFLSILWKTNTALFTPLFIRLKKFKIIIITILTTAAITIPYFYFYPGSWQKFMINFGHVNNSYIGNMGLNQLLFNLLNKASLDLINLWGHSYFTISLINYALMFVVVLVTFLKKNFNPLINLALWTTLYFLTYHQVWEHHYTMILPILILVFLTTRSWIVFICWLLLALPTPFFFFFAKRTALLNAPYGVEFLTVYGINFPYWQDIIFHASKVIPTVILFIWLMAFSFKNYAKN